MPIKIRLQELAQSRGLNQSQVQRRTGLTMTQVRRYWRNETSEVSLHALDAPSDLLQVAPGGLLIKTQESEQAASPA